MKISIRYYITEAAVLGLLVLLQTGCRLDRVETSSILRSGASSRIEKLTAEHWLFLRLDDFAGNYIITLNGFPVESEPVNIRAADEKTGTGLTTALTREGNTATLKVDPYTERIGSQLNVRSVQLEGRVTRKLEDGSYEPIGGTKAKDTPGINAAQVDSAYRAWTDRANKRWQDYRSRTTNSQEALDSIRAWADRNPMTVSTTFHNEAGPDFSDIFEEAPVISDTSRLKDYAIHLRDLMAERDTAALFDEFRPSIMDRFEMRSFDSRDRYLEKNRNAVVLEGAILDFGRDDVRVRRWVDGRVWEIWRAGSDNDAFFETPSGYGTGELYVAEVDGRLRVVR